jgi:hypothetical protein
MNRLTYTLLCCLGGGLYGWIGDGGHVSSSVLSYPPSQRFWFPGLAWWVIPQFAVGGGVLSYIVASVVKAQQMRVLADNFPSYQRSLLGVALSLGTYLFSSVLFHFRVPQPIISLLLLGCTIGLFYYLRLPQRSPKAFLAIGSACFFGGIAWESSLCHFSFFRYEQPDLGLWVSHWIGLLWVGAVWSASLVMWRWEVTHAAEEEALHGKKIDAHAEVTYSGLKKSTTMYAAVAQYREKFRTEAIPKEYSVYDHFGLINAVGITLIGLTCWQAGGPTTMLSNRASQILMVIAFIQSNAFEYYAHRQKLHAPFVHTRHSHTHHRYFTDRVMEFDHFRDAHAILFPERAPYFLAVLISVFAFIPWLVCGWQPAMAYSCVLASYYLSYGSLKSAQQMSELLVSALLIQLPPLSVLCSPLSRMDAPRLPLSPGQLSRFSPVHSVPARAPSDPPLAVAHGQVELQYHVAGQWEREEERELEVMGQGKRSIQLLFARSLTDFHACLTTSSDHRRASRHDLPRSSPAARHPGRARLRGARGRRASGAEGEGSRTCERGPDEEWHNRDEGARG